MRSTIKLLYSEGHKIDEWNIAETKRANGSSSFGLKSQSGGYLDGYQHYNSKEELIAALKQRFNTRITFNGSTPFTTYFLVKRRYSYGICNGHTTSEKCLKKSTDFLEIKKRYDELTNKLPMSK